MGESQRRWRVTLSRSSSRAFRRTSPLAKSSDGTRLARKSKALADSWASTLGEELATDGWRAPLFFGGGGGGGGRPAAAAAALALQSPPHSPTVDPLSRCMLPFKARAGARWMLSRRFLGNKSCHPRPRGPTPMSFFSRAVDRSSEKDFFRSAASTRPPPFPLTLSFPSSSSTNQLLNRLSASAASLRASSSPRTRPSSASSSATSSTPRPSATCR